MNNWVIYNKKKNIKEISQKFGITPLTSVLLCNRDIYEEDDVKKILSSDIHDLNSPLLLPDIEKATRYIYAALKNGKNIRIVGDYDIDGVVSTFILYDSLLRLGAKISYDIPDRLKDGYGINNAIIDKAIADKIDVIITCDNGIAASEQIKYAHNSGIEVVVTDHHDISNLPEDAVAIVNPKREDAEVKYPFKNICGAVVAWKIVSYLYNIAHVENFDPIEYYLEFAMIATIGDIMPLVNENHIIAKLGLKKILKTNNKGLKKLLDVSAFDYKNKGIDVFHIGFIIGPLINAAGRMDDASSVVRLFLENDEHTIDSLAKNLKLLNDDRKQMTEDGVSLAIDKVEKNFKNDKILVLYVESLGEQVAGIVAGRVKEKYNKPTIILTDTYEDNEAKASCRSIEAYDIFEGLSKHSDMFLKFGGHKLAAGFTILKKDIDVLRKYLNEETILTEKDFVKKMYIDVEVSPTEFNESIIEDMEKLIPYGQGFSKPSFAVRDVETKISGIFGSDRNVVKLDLLKNGEVMKGVIFTDGDSFAKRMSENNHISFIYTPKVNEYKGFRNIEIVISDYKSS